MIDRVLLLSLGGGAVFGSMLYLELTSADRSAPVDAGPRARVEVPADTRRPSPQIGGLVTTILGRPLFSSTRTPERANGDHSGSPGLANLRLSGIVIEPEHRLAIFAVPGSKPLVRSEGETLNDWHLDRITPSEVSLSGPDGTTTMVPKTDPSIVRSAPPARTAANVVPPTPPARPPVVPGLRVPMPPRPQP